MNKGILYAIGAYGMWGFFPLYWKWLQGVPALEILVHRMVWSLVFVGLLLAIKKDWAWVMPALKDRRTRSATLRLTADIAVRVERRFKEMFEKNPNVTIEEVKSNLEMRDYIDSNRDVSPLRQAKDAIVLDNTNLTMEQQLKFALNTVEKAIN